MGKWSISEWFGITIILDIDKQNHNGKLTLKINSRNERVFLCSNPLFFLDNWEWNFNFTALGNKFYAQFYFRDLFLLGKLERDLYFIVVLSGLDFYEGLLQDWPSHFLSQYFGYFFANFLVRTFMIFIYDFPE
jgi:hypothetical protein